ncbi:MAG TPA: tetratricopeptide repeat protein, partial [Polyangiales bacterium]|nr:tetratricopeptide repeat protein [Polyangiales bacterium]
MLFSAAAARAESVDEATRSAASTLGYAGIESFEAGDFAAASARLEKAYALLKVPSLGLWSARALVALGSFVRAWQRYAEVAHLSL